MCREGRLAGEEGVGGGGEAVEVGAAVDMHAAGDLFGRTVAGAADEGAGEGEFGVGQRGDARQAEVGQFDHRFAGGIAGAHEVGGLDVAVDDSGAVGRGQPAEGVAQGQRRFAPIERPVGAQALGQRAALDIFHRNVRPARAGLPAAALLADGIDRDDVRMIELRRRLRLAQKPLGDRGRRSLRLRRRHAQNLDRQVPVQDIVVRQVHRPHAPLAQRAQQTVWPQRVLVAGGRNVRGVLHGP